MLRNGEADRVGGLEVEHKLELGRHLHPQIGRLLAFENAPDIIALLTVGIVWVSPLADEASGGHILAKREIAGIPRCAANTAS
jgi:hypothetical protein